MRSAKQVFVDTAIWCASTNAQDESHGLAVRLMNSHRHNLVTSDYVIMETWWVIHARLHARAANRVVDTILAEGLVDIIDATAHDIQAALRIGERFEDHDFSLVDRTSWAIMERCGITEALTFDRDFEVYRYGPDKDQALTVHR